jgi:hypothetical protein
MSDFRLETFLRQRVVLDTQGPLVFIGTLAAVEERGYWLTDADVHDRNDGHSTKEVYVSNARELEKGGSRNVNRRRVFVERSVVASISALADVVFDADNQDDE